MLHTRTSLVIAWSAAVAVAGGARAQDTVRLALPVADAVVDAVLYPAPGTGPKPTLLLLHGFPGNQQNIDIAAAVQASGRNAVLMHYRGSWGSTGYYSPLNSLVDVQQVLVALRSQRAVEEWGVDGARIALFGHSAGAWAALMSAAGDSAVRCVAATSVTNLGMQARRAAVDDGFRARMSSAIAASTQGATPPIRVRPGSSLVQELIDAADQLDLMRQIQPLATRKLLLIGGSADLQTAPAEHLQPLLNALALEGAGAVATLMLPADHNFSAHRGQVITAVLRWLESECGY